MNDTLVRALGGGGKDAWVKGKTQIARKRSQCRRQPVCKQQRTISSAVVSYYAVLLFLATVSAQRSLWNGTTQSGSEVAAHSLTINSLHGAGSFLRNLTVTLLVKKFVTFRQPGRPMRVHKNPPLGHIPWASWIHILPYVMLLTVKFADDLGNGLL
jgi:hypothetical protein